MSQRRTQITFTGDQCWSYWCWWGFDCSLLARLIILIKKRWNPKVNLTIIQYNWHCGKYNMQLERKLTVFSTAYPSCVSSITTLDNQDCFFHLAKNKYWKHTVIIPSKKKKKSILNHTDNHLIIRMLISKSPLQGINNRRLLLSQKTKILYKRTFDSSSMPVHTFFARR